MVTALRLWRENQHVHALKGSLSDAVVLPYETLGGALSAAFRCLPSLGDVTNPAGRYGLRAIPWSVLWHLSPSRMLCMPCDGGPAVRQIPSVTGCCQYPGMGARPAMRNTSVNEGLVCWEVSYRHDPLRVSLVWSGNLMAFAFSQARVESLSFATKVKSSLFQ